jgi:NADPH-dependent 2,4-dienoyl-CoA reductase/sulfur reductase-like enzyme
VHHDYDFLVVGGGMVADAAARAIREQGAEGSIGIVGEEPTAPFPRPALSKKLWTDPDFTVENTDPGTAADTGATLHLGVRATGIDAGARTVQTDDGDTFGYGALLIATGGHPRRIEGLEPSDRVFYYRTLTDYLGLRALAGGGIDVAVVGAGYIGLEMAAALSQQDCRVTLVHPGERLGEATFPDAVCDRLEQAYAAAGVRVVSGSRVTGGRQDGDRVTLELSTGAVLDVDAVVVGLGIEPAGGFAAGAVEVVDGAVVVDEHLRTSAPDVLAAGDVASYPDPVLGRTRVEHVDNAETMGATAGRVMAGSDEAYDHTPMFYSDLFDDGYEAVGTLSTDLEVVVDQGDDGLVAYYLDDTEVRGVLLWNTWDKVEAATALLAEHRRPANPTDLLGSL